jgi:hypothetical protein
VPVLARPGQALNLAIHAAHHGRDYSKGSIELRRALRRWPVAVWRDAAALAAEIDAIAPFALGLRQIAPEGIALAEDLRLASTEGFERAFGHGADRPRGSFHVAAFETAPGLRGRLALARRALFPQRRWLEVEFHWTTRGPLRPLRVAIARVLHLARVPVWALRAWSFSRRARRTRRAAGE